MYRISNVFLLFICLVYTQTLYAYDEKRAISNLASDYSRCASYYLIAKEGVIKTGKKEIAEQFDKPYKLSFMTAVRLSNVKVTEARVELSVKSQMKEMGKNYSNFAILINKYGEFCKQLINNPDKRLKYWLKKK